MGSFVIALSGKHKPKLRTELFEHELFAIGYVTTQWAYVEHLLLLHTVELAEKLKIPIPEQATSLAFKRRMDAFRAIVKRTYRHKRDSKKRERLLKIATEISGQERSRNRIAHGLWDWTNDAPEKAHASSLRPPYQFEEHFDFNKMMKIGDRLGELAFELEYPGGEKQAHKALVESAMQPGGSISRLGLLMLTGRLPPQHPLATIVQGRRQRQRSESLQHASSKPEPDDG